METLIATIAPRTAFGGAIRGDTLFGQLCWAALHRWGEAQLGELLDGYTNGRPFLVISDAFPAGYLPRPALPMYRYADVPGTDRKQVKKRHWLPQDAFSQPLVEWLQHAVSQGDIADKLVTSRTQAHNTINRMTGTTGTGEFAPYGMVQQWFANGQLFDLYVAHDAQKISSDEIATLLHDVGLSGYGRDASIGLGKFDLQTLESKDWPQQQNADAWMTLAPCAPQGLDFDPEWSWYQPFTRFGRHGDQAVHSGRPFKNPVLLTDTGALLTPKDFSPVAFTGQGLGGEGRISKAVTQTVQQGYAPVLPIALDKNTMEAMA